MPMDSLEYKELLHRFGKDLKRTDEDLYEATTDDVDAEQRERAIAAGRRKLAEWDAMLARLDEGERRTAEDDFGERVADIRAALAQLEKEGA